MRLCAIAMLAAGLAAGLAAPAGAQHAADPETLCDPASHPLDAVTAAPYSHIVLFEDAHVRVLEIVLPPLAVEPPHIHALPSVIQGDTGGAAGAKFLYIEYAWEDGRLVETDKREITPTPGFRTVWASPEGPHAIANVGQAPVRFMRTEIKPESCAK